MVRAAAKNANDVVIITDKEDYSDFIREIKKELEIREIPEIEAKISFKEENKDE